MVEIDDDGPEAFEGTLMDGLEDEPYEIKSNLPSYDITELVRFDEKPDGSVEINPHG